VDIVADLERGLPFLPDACVDEVYTRSFLEHVQNFEHLLREILRVLKPSGYCHAYVPHFSNPYYYSDYTHVRFFGLYSFYYFAPFDQQPRRKVPNYARDVQIEVGSIRLEFASPWRSRNRLKKIVERIVNLNEFTREFYEENLSWIFPCYGIAVSFRRAQGPSGGLARLQ
jgi:ubiquinone/menaquinone biosynthesis C-methylase UbiE